MVRNQSSYWQQQQNPAPAIFLVGGLASLLARAQAAAKSSARGSARASAAELAAASASARRDASPLTFRKSKSGILLLLPIGERASKP